MNEQQRKFDLFNQRISSIKQEISDKDNGISFFILFFLF